MIQGLIVSLVLVTICVVIHAVGLVLLADWLIRHPLKQEPRFNIRRYSQLLIAVFSVITILHLLETLVWAAFFDLGLHFQDFETSWYFSLGSYTTIGYGDVVLPARWRIMGGIEGINGVLLCGLSTAFLFAIVNQIFVRRVRSGLAGYVGPGPSDPDREE